MKPVTSFALLSALATAAASAAVTTPVGYNTVDLVNGFNFVGLTLHESVVVSGDLESYGTGTATDSDVDFDTVLTAGTTYILEVGTPAGISEAVASWTGNTLNTSTDLSAVLAGGESYSIRPAATLASVFGADGGDLSKGFFGPGTSDQIWLFNGTGYDKYYYDSGTAASGGTVATWRQLTPVDQDVDGAAVPIQYPEGFLIVSSNPKSLVFTGEVKLAPTEVNLVSGFNFVSSVAPVGATLATAFGVDGDSLRKGFFGPGTGDQIWIFNGTGYDKYYYDSGTAASGGTVATWRQLAPVEQDIADPSAVALPTGYLVVSSSAGDVTQGLPAYVTE